MRKIWDWLNCPTKKDDCFVIAAILVILCAISLGLILEYAPKY